MKSVKKNRIMKRSKSQPFPAFRSSTAITNPFRPAPKGLKEGQYRDKETIKRINMYNSKPNLKKMKEQPLEPVRINPDRRWFGNTRVITQEQMKNFREELEDYVKHPRSHVIKRSKLPMSLLKDDDIKVDNANILTIHSMEDAFGKKSTRKRPKLNVSTFEEMMEDINKRTYDQSNDKSLVYNQQDDSEVSDIIFKKGTSKRIWAELYKVIDCSDVIIQVIDARDPMGTRCLRLENYIRKHKQSKVLVLLMNKCDLVPSWVTAAWIKHLNRNLTTVAFHASVKNPFGKNTLIQLLKQYSQLFKDKKHFSVGFIGYPNVGKSSVINTLRGDKCCKTAPIPGETRVWQYVCLTKRIHLIDCPGVTPCEEGEDADKVLKGAIRVERISDPENYIQKVLELIERDVLIQRYGISKDFTEENFLDQIAIKFGKLKPGNLPDVSTAARIVLYDFQRGRLPFYTQPPKDVEHLDPTIEIKKHLEDIVNLNTGEAQPINEEELDESTLTKINDNDLSNIHFTEPSPTPTEGNPERSPYTTELLPGNFSDAKSPGGVCKANSDVVDRQDDTTTPKDVDTSLFDEKKRKTDKRRVGGGVSTEESSVSVHPQSCKGISYENFLL